MRDRRLSRVAAVLGAVVAVAVIAGCTGATGGRPTPVASPPSTSDLTNAAGSLHLPSPPKDLSLAGVDPCTLLTPAQQAQLGVRPGFRIANDQKYHGPRCNFRLISNGGAPTTAYFDINTVTSAGVTTWLDPYLYDSITEQDVNGYPGLRIYPKGGNGSALECTDAIGVANGQMLMVMFAYVPLGTPQQQACARTEQVATAAMTTLQSMK